MLHAIGKRRGLALEAQEAADLLGLGREGLSVVAGWIAGPNSIPYPCWAMLCEMAGLGLIWRIGDRPNLLNLD